MGRRLELLSLSITTAGHELVAVQTFATLSGATSRAQHSRQPISAYDVQKDTCPKCHGRSFAFMMSRPLRLSQ